MKKDLLFTALFSLLFVAVQGQITITNAIFPDANDVVTTGTDNFPSIELGEPGENKIWDFSGLETVFTNDVTYKMAQEGNAFSVFPEAELVIQLANGVGETYFDVTDTEVALLGYTGGDPIGLGLDIQALFSPTAIQLRAPMNYQDNNTDISKSSIAFAWEDLPEVLTDSLNLAFTPDSIRIDLDSKRVDEIDAWGELTLPVGTFDVLRERRFEERETSLWAKVGIGIFSTWINISDVLPGANQLLGKDTTLTYNFFTNTTKEPVAVVRVNKDSEEVERVEYKADEELTSTKDLYPTKPNVFAHPNPAIEDVRFEFTNLKPGQYTLKIYNILGLSVWEQNYDALGIQSVYLNLAEFRKGTYLYSLIDQSGKTLMTKRLMVIRP
ncbi:MAG: T9SS type A sorting domain-containing protein [Saprospiraceae bacterium]